MATKPRGIKALVAGPLTNNFFFAASLKVLKQSSKLRVLSSYCMIFKKGEKRRRRKEGNFWKQDLRDIKTSEAIYLTLVLNPSNSLWLKWQQFFSTIPPG